MFQILKRWHERHLLTVEDVVEAMVEWQREGYLDIGVWNRIRLMVDPGLIPASSAPRLRLPAREAHCPLELQFEVCRIFRYKL